MTIEIERLYSSADFSEGLHKTLRSYTDTIWSVAMWNIIHPLPANIWSKFCTHVDDYIGRNLEGELNKELFVKAIKDWQNYWYQNCGTLARHSDTRHIGITFNALWTMAIDEDCKDLDTLVSALSHIYNRK